MMIYFFILLVAFVASNSKAQYVVDLPEENPEYFPVRESFDFPAGDAETFVPDTQYDEEVPTESDFFPSGREVVFIIPRRRPSIFDRIFGGQRPSFPRFPQFSTFFPLRPTVDEDQNDTHFDLPSVFHRPSFPFNFPSLFPQRPSEDNNDTDTDSILPPFDHPIFETPDFSSLPDNYTNSTHDVHYVDGKKVIVNQTIEKSSGPNFKNFFHFKVFHSHPHQDESPAGETPVDPSETFPEVDLEPPRGDTPIEREPVDSVYPEDPLVDEAENEIAIPKKLVQNEEPGRYTRALADDPSTNPNDLDSSEEKDSEGIKKKHKSEDDSVEVLPGGIRPPDLSKDTRVNSIAASGDGQQQGMTLVDPDAEVFDLGLVIKENESHDV